MINRLAFISKRVQAKKRFRVNQFNRLEMIDLSRNVFLGVTDDFGLHKKPRRNWYSSW
jgi:hypothetical protein